MAQNRGGVMPRAPGPPPPTVASGTGHIWAVGGAPGGAGVPEPTKRAVFRRSARKNVKNLRLGGSKGDTKKSVQRTRLG